MTSFSRNYAPQTPEWQRAQDGLVHAYAGAAAHPLCTGYQSTPVPADVVALAAKLEPNLAPEDYRNIKDDGDADDCRCCPECEALREYGWTDEPLDVPLGPDTCVDCVREITRLHTQAGAA